MAACVAGAALLCFQQAVRQAQLPFQLDYEEGNVLNAGVRITQGLTPYPDPHLYPSVLNPYGPIGYLLVAQCVRLGGIRFVLPRFVMLAFALAIVLLLFRIIREWTGSYLVAFSFGLYFLVTDPAQAWMPLSRVDLPAIALSMTGLWLCLPALAGRDCSERRTLAAGLFFALAIFVKYTVLAAPATCVLCLAARRDWKRALLVAGTLGGLSLAGFAWMQKQTRGQFAFHMFGTHADPYRMSWLLHNVASLGLSVAALLLLLLAFLLIRPWTPRPAMVYLACACTVAMITGGKLGSAENHFLEFMGACSIAAALGYQKLASETWPQPLVPLFPLGVGIAALSLSGAFMQSAELPKVGISGCADLYGRVRESPGREMLTENIGAAVLAGKVPFVSNPFVHTQLEQAGILSPKPLEAAVAARRFDQIVLNVDPAEPKGYETLRWRGPLLALIAKNYRISQFFDCQDGRYLFEPNGPEKPGTAGEKPPAVPGHAP
jgi:hypothetical protein